MDKTAKAAPFRDTKTFQLVYKVGIGVKGFDGLVELVAGLVLWLSPGLVASMLASIGNRAATHQGAIYSYVGHFATQYGRELKDKGALFLIIFLISHGVIKLILVYALLKEIIWAYPYALVTLIGFLIYQIYVLITAPTIGMFVLAVLDVAIIWLVWQEYRELKSKGTV